MAGSDDVLPLVAPPPVATVAARLGLGELLERVGREDNTRTMTRFLLFSGLGSLVISCAALVPGFVKLAIPLFAYGIVAVIWSIIGKARGTPHRFLYEGGVVEEVRGKVTAVQWSDVAELEVQYFGERALFSGKIKGYLLRLRSGGQFMVPSADGLGLRGPFEDRLVDLLQVAGVRTTQRVV
jgi:hypothetical protein